jgi:hypothetical protein
MNIKEKIIEIDIKSKIFQFLNKYLNGFDVTFFSIL